METQYQSLYQQSIENPEAFWAKIANAEITWFSPWTTVKTGSFNEGNLKWFVDAKLNISVNCLDRHLKHRSNQVAILWEGDDPSHSKSLTYAQLYDQVCRCANLLKQQGIQKGDRVCIYLPMIPEVAVAMLACARIGAVHTVVFAGFSPEALKVRILDCDCQLVITANEGIRGNKHIPLKHNVDIALESCPRVSKVIVIPYTSSNVAWVKGRDIHYHDEMHQMSSECAPEVMDADDPFFILYTSGSTGKPKGVLHTTAGYIVYVSTTFKTIFDYQDHDIFWCTADVGWITGHSYMIYGPLCNGATTLLFEGIPSYPTYARYWEIVDKYHVNILYTSPTAIRSLRKEGDERLKSTSRKSLKLLGSVGEPINPDVWEWYYEMVGQSRCPVVDTWWQTETGGILISPIPRETPLKAGSASWPFYGIKPGIVDDNGQEIADDTPGRLVIKDPWPGMMKTIYGDHKRFMRAFEEVPGCYLTGDGAHRDREGYYWISGRNDDVIKISGHRIGTEEVESALLTHESVSEAAVVAVYHEIKGQSIYAFVSTKATITPNETLKEVLIQTVRHQIGPIATPDTIHFAENLPKTRSGKIMRRLLRKIANNELDELGDISTLADPSVIEELLKK